MKESVLVLLDDCTAVHSYDTLLEKAALLLPDEGQLDVLVTRKITHLNVLDGVLATTYTLCTDILTRLGKPRVYVTVLYNEHFLEQKQTWNACVIDPSDDAFHDWGYDSKEQLELHSVQRSSTTPSTIMNDHDESEESIHQVSAVGGTFDHFHDGHKMLLTASAFVTKNKLIVGVTDHELLKNKKFPEFLQSYEDRVRAVKDFLARVKPHLEVDAVPIRDVCGPTGTIADIDALIVSRETIKGAEFINKTRRERGFNELRVHVVNVIGGEEDDGFENKLSSTQLRREQWESTKLTAAASN